MDGDVVDYLPLAEAVSATSVELSCFLKTETVIPGIDLVEQTVDDLLGTGRSIDQQRSLPSLPRRREDDIVQIIDMVNMVMGNENRADSAHINPRLKQLVDRPSSRVKQQQVRANFH
jgi:hypothetical protein